eukprot:8514281-Alexandrium_andersonii.AAC.1
MVRQTVPRVGQSQLSHAWHCRLVFRQIVFTARRIVPSIAHCQRLPVHTPRQNVPAIRQRLMPTEAFAATKPFHFL